MTASIFDPTRVDAAPAAGGNTEFVLGQIATDYKGDEYMFIRAAAAMAAHDVAVITEAYSARGALASQGASGDRVGVALTAIPNGSYGWVSRKGRGDINVRASCAANAQLYTSGTSGSLDDDSTSQEAIDGIVLTTARAASAGTAPAVWDYPHFA